MKIAEYFKIKGREEGEREEKEGTNNQTAQGWHLLAERSILD